MSESRRVLVVGGGFGGLALVRGLRGAAFDVTLVDRRNFHLFQPLLYQVATGGLSPSNIASPLRRILRKRRDVRVLLGEVRGFDLDRRRAQLADGAELAYDVLVVAAGSRTNYFGHAAWAQTAPGLKGIEDAVEIRARVFSAFENAERAASAAEVGAFLTFAVVGAGPTGVELAGALAEIARDTLRREFRNIDPSRARILLIEGSDRVLPSYPEDLSERARESLRALGVDVLVRALVTDVDERGLSLRRGDETEPVACRTVLWTAGVRASPLGPMLAAAAGVAPDEMDRVVVGPRLQLAGHDEVFAIGDIARCDDQEGRPLPAVAPVAIQQGRYVARLLRRAPDARPADAFRYRRVGEMATIGRKSAVAAIGRVHFSGRLAWIAWLGAHLMWLVEFENRLLVLIQWAWSYVTFHRSSRLITGERTKDDG